MIFPIKTHRDKWREQIIIEISVMIILLMLFPFILSFSFYLQGLLNG